MSSPIRLGGLSSGLDVEGFVARLMQMERRPLDALSARQEALNGRMKAWSELRSRLTELQNRLATLQSAATFTGFKASSGDTALVTASVTGTPELKSYSVQVLALARNTIYESQPPAVITDPAAAVAGLETTEFDIIDADGSRRNGATPLRIEAGWSLNQIRDYLNGLGLNLKATVLEKNPGDFRLVVQDTRTGAGTHFTFSAVSGTGLDTVGLTQPGALVQAAANASIQVDGVTVSRATNVFSDVIPGLSLTAQKVGGPTTVTAARDTDKAYAAIKGFVDAYNALQNTVRTYASYDEKTKRAGPLFGDSGLDTLVSTLRQKVTAVVPGVAPAANSLAMIGISTARATEADFKSGSLKIDDTRLRAALNSHLAEIQQLFTQAGTGLAHAVKAYVDTFAGGSGVITRVTESLQQQVNGLQDRMDYLKEVILPQKEARLRQRFVALDRALASMQAQSQWLSAQIGSLGGQKQQ